MVALCGVAATQPVLPSRVFLQVVGHLLDDAGQFGPALQAQGGAGVPFELFVGQLLAVGNAVVVAQRSRHVLVLRVVVSQYAPCEAALFAAQTGFHAGKRRSCGGGFARVFADDVQKAVFARTLRAAFKRAAQCGCQAACVAGLAVAQQSAHAAPCVVAVQTTCRCRAFDQAGTTRRQFVGNAHKFCRHVVAAAAQLGITLYFLHPTRCIQLFVFLAEHIPLSACAEAFEPFVADGFSHRAVAHLSQELLHPHIVAAFGSVQRALILAVIGQYFGFAFRAAGGDGGGFGQGRGRLFG